MPAEPSKTASVGASRGLTLYRQTVRQAASDGAVLLGKLITLARQALQTQEAASRDLRDRNGLAEAAQMLRKHEHAMCDAFPKALLDIFSQSDGSRKSVAPAVTDVQFDQLELMDETQVLSTVAVARLLQVVKLAAELPLAELDRLISGVLGLDKVSTEANVLRPESYVQALQNVVSQAQVPPAMQAQWFNTMAAPLGAELRALYTSLCAQLRQQGAVSVAYAVTGARGAGKAGAATGSAPQPEPGPVSQDVHGAPAQPFFSPSTAGNLDTALLTLDKLRRLLAGEAIAVQPANRVEQFAQHFSRQFEDSSPVPEASAQTDFASTVPAALEALTEMKQVERVVQSLEQRRDAARHQPEPLAQSIEGQRLALRRGAKDLAQALSLEVVTLMVDNMARDPRLLEPVREVIRNLEPALLRLALVDMRFFSDKQHAARRLLQEVSQRSMAFASVQTRGFDTFYQELLDALSPLFNASIESAEVFEGKLAQLQERWRQDGQSHARERAAAVEVLSHAEARNLLAEKIAKGIEGHAAAAQVPAVVMDFLCGPWSQVVAQARIKQGAGSVAAEKFEGLIPTMLWSAHPELARANPVKLTRLIPRLVETLREGLQTIQYPQERAQGFLESLMTIHQQSLRPASAVPAAAQAAVPSDPRSLLLDDNDPWLGPQEAQASNFVELGDMQPDVAPAQREPLVPAPQEDDAGKPQPEADMPLGSWVELKMGDQWVRTQLTWASPHGTLYLFTGVFGNTQSMSRRLRDKLLASGKLRLLSGQAFVEGALDAVAQTAIRNSVGNLE